MAKKIRLEEFIAAGKIGVGAKLRTDGERPSLTTVVASVRFSHDNKLIINDREVWDTCAFVTVT